MNWGLRKKPEVLAAQKPKFSSHGGKTWDSHIDIHMPDGSVVMGHLETTWGMYVYFYAKGRWWKIDAMALEGRYADELYLSRWRMPKKFK